MAPIYEEFPAIPDAIRAWADRRGLVVSFTDLAHDDFTRNRFSALVEAPHMVQARGPGAGRPPRFALLGIDPVRDDPAESVAKIEAEWARGRSLYGVVPRAGPITPPAPA